MANKMNTYADATKKAEFRQDSKIREGVKFLDTVQYENLDEFYAIAQSLNSQLPSTDGNKNFFFTNEDINETIIRLAEHYYFQSQIKLKLTMIRHCLI